MSDTKTFAGRFDQIRPICQFILAGADGFDKRGRFHIELACDEACTNIIEHAYGGEGNGDIAVTWERSDEAFTITLRDSGKPFQPSKVVAPAPIAAETPIEDVTVGGLGVHFMRKLMDEVLFSFDEDGNTLTMIKWTPPDGVTVRHTELADGTGLLRIFGRVDQTILTELETQLNDLLTHSPLTLIIDLSHSNYINSGGLRVLVTAWRKARQQQGAIVLCGLDERLREIFAMVGFDKIFHIYPDIPAAQSALTQAV